MKNLKLKKELILLLCSEVAKYTEDITMKYTGDTDESYTLQEIAKMVSESMTER